MPTLYYSPTSPYARKVRVLLRELAMTDVDEALVLPLDDPPALRAANPLGKVPVLLLDDGSALFDSRVICAWLLARAGVEVEPGRHWPMQRRASLAEGGIDASVAMVLEKRRPREQQSPYWLARWREAIERSLDVLAGELGQMRAGVDAIGLAVLLGHLVHRHRDLDWRARQPDLGVWYDVFAQRPSMRATEPPAGS